MSDESKAMAQALMEALAQALVKIAVHCSVPKHRLQEMISLEYDVERNNRRSPQ